MARICWLMSGAVSYSGTNSITFIDSAANSLSSASRGSPWRAHHSAARGAPGGSATSRSIALFIANSVR